MQKLRIKNKLKYGVVLLAVVLIGYFFYSVFLSPTKIALLNFPSYQVSSMKLANGNDFFIRVDEILPDDASRLSHYDAILMFAPGLRLTNEESMAIDKARKKGAFIYSAFFRSHTIGNTPLDSVQEKHIMAYFSNRSQDNYRNLALYIREHFDTKKIFSNKSKEAKIFPTELFYYLEKETYFRTAKELETYLRSKNLYKEDAPRIAFCTGIVSPLEGHRAYVDSMIIAMSNAGFNVFPICSDMSKRLDFLKEVVPQAVVYLPMGRLANDEGVEWLKENNIPLFCPFPMFQPRQEWLKNTTGQAGGALTARIVLAEIDGGICPFAISTENKRGDLYFFDSEPERVDFFVKNMKNYLSLRTKANEDKKVVIFYFKGPGKTALHATGLEVAPSLYNLLKRLKKEGYKVENLPDSFDEFNEMVKFQGKFFSHSSQGAIDEYLAHADPLWITKTKYDRWVKQRVAPSKYEEVVAEYGDFPGSYMNRGDSLAVPFLRFGNIVLLPQPRPAFEGDDFKVTHGVNVPPPHSYIAPYLWAQQEFKADALLHFGTHGNLEFIPGKQNALSHKDWADCLIGSIPHFYYYCIANVGESIIAKRRTHATIVSYLTPPFRENKTQKQFKKLFDAIDEYHQAGKEKQDAVSLRIKKMAVDFGLHKDLHLDGDLSKPYAHEDIHYIENFVVEITNEKITGKLYTLGEPYTKENLSSSALAITVDPLAYSLARLDLLHRKISREEYENRHFITKKYLQPIKQKMQRKLENKSLLGRDIYEKWHITSFDIEKAHEILDFSRSKKDKKKWMTEDKKWAEIILDVQEAVENVSHYYDLLQESPELEMQSLLNAFNGAYIPPSPGGDAVRSPNTLPTGRNLYSINAEATPSEKAWETGKMLAEKTLEQYRKKHNQYPRKVSYTFWAGEFIESEGATVAQVLYMLGVKPMYDGLNRVVDLQLIPSDELGRPRIDVVLQVSGQLRDLAASRLFLITKAVELVSKQKNESHPNFVAEGTVSVEKSLIEKGYTIEKARELSIMRVFGAMNGRYGTGIMDLVEKGDAWDTKSEIASTYLNNMGAIYSDEEHWGDFNQNLFEAALERTDVVIQPRQNNTWGALSLDHMYEFMGGLNLSVNEVTGKAPETYLADYRNRHHMRLQELKEAIGIESRTTLLNPEYIREKMKGGAGSAETFAKTFRNTYGWDVMKDDAIDNELWERLHDVYIKDVYKLNVQAFFEDKNPEALQEITAVMLETARKGMWKTSKENLQQVADLHSYLVNKYEPSGSYFTNNKKLQQFINTHITDKQQAEMYNAKVQKISEQGGQTIILKKEQNETTQKKIFINNWWVWVLLLLVFLFFWRKKKR